MHRQKSPNDAVHNYMSELTSRVVAASGIPSDRFHLGKIILQSLKDDPGYILQINGATNESETSGSVLERSVICANALKAIGLQRGDVMILMAPLHLDLAIPYYAALFLGIIIAPIDRTLTVAELQGTFNVNRPKIVFCQSERASDVQKALKDEKVEAQIFTFDKVNGFKSFFELMEIKGNGTVEDFEPTDFDPEDTTAFLVATSGTTGLPKSAAGTHKNFAVGNPYYWSRYSTFPSPTRMYLVVSPLQWLSAIVHFNLSPIFRYTRLHSSLAMTPEHTHQLIKTYKPTSMLISPTMMTGLLKPGVTDICDFTSFEDISLGGSAVPEELINEIKCLSPDTDAYNIYGTTEMMTWTFVVDNSPIGSPGKPIRHVQVRIINVETQEEIIEANVPGEMWLKGPTMFKGYYNNPEATEESITADGWFQTGDIFYRDEDDNFFFVDRLKLLLKYMNHQISPVEVENVIRKHPAVLDVAVSGIPDRECGDLIVACVVRREGCNVTAQDIKDLVKESLTDSKQLRGGVIFLKELPMTSTTKIHRRKLKEIVKEMKKE